MTAAPLMPDIHVDDAATPGEIRAFFEHDRLLSAYALADLDPANVDTARWWVARRGRDIVAGALLVEIMPFRPCFAMGESDALAAVFHELREQRLILAVPPRARPAVEQTYRLERVDLMRRMAVNAAAFSDRAPQRPSRLGPEHREDLIDLYGEASRSYFTPQRLAREIYYGVFDGRRIVSAAGTHVRSAQAGIAAVGNVLTRIGHRDRGLATAVTSAVTEEALREHRDVVLNVRQDNLPATRVYERLGYHTHATFIEGPAVRRAPWERIANIWRR